MISTYKAEQILAKFTYKNNTADIKVNIFNNTQEELTGNVYAVVYGEDGVVKKIAVRSKIKIDGYSDASIDFEIENYSYTAGDYVKTFLWSNEMIPLCDFEFYEIDINQ